LNGHRAPEGFGEPSRPKHSGHLTATDPLIVSRRNATQLIARTNVVLTVLARLSLTTIGRCRASLLPLMMNLFSSAREARETVRHGLPLLGAERCRNLSHQGIAAVWPGVMG
jgi:hypothetical protein